MPRKECHVMDERPRLLKPCQPLRVGCVEREIQLRVLDAARTEDGNVPHSAIIVGFDRHLLTERFGPQVRIQLAVAQMVRLADEDTHPRKAINHLPQLCSQLLIIH